VFLGSGAFRFVAFPSSAFTNVYYLTRFVNPFGEIFLTFFDDCLKTPTPQGFGLKKIFGNQGELKVAERITRDKGTWGWLVG
ncbi:hypothetical protein, partial [Limnospira platensis]|uniref:hypothetical protein n=1 Tax=Limnospira platensis TaxID=118562 RepID=UPI00396C3FB7